MLERNSIPVRDQIPMIIDLNVNHGMTVADISKQIGYPADHVRRILKKEGFIIINHGRKNQKNSDSHNKSVSEYQSKRPFAPRKKASELSVRKQMVKRSGRPSFSLDKLNKYTNLERLQFLLRKIPKMNRKVGADRFSDDYVLSFLERFYFDSKFNLIFDRWAASGYDVWLQPTVDHIQPISRGGSHEIENIQFLTWFENRAKANMTADEWQNVKSNIQFYMI